VNRSNRLAGNASPADTQAYLTIDDLILGTVDDHRVAY